MPREIDEAFIEEAVERYRRIDAMREEFDKALADMEVTVRSPDGSVAIVVSGTGEFRDVVISPDVGETEMNSKDLAQAVLAACQAASGAGDWARRKLYEETFHEYRPLA